MHARPVAWRSRLPSHVAAPWRVTQPGLREADQHLLTIPLTWHELRALWFSHDLHRIIGWESVTTHDATWLKDCIAQPRHRRVVDLVRDRSAARNRQAARRGVGPVEPAHLTNDQSLTTRANFLRDMRPVACEESGAAPSKPMQVWPVQDAVEAGDVFARLGVMESRVVSVAHRSPSQRSSGSSSCRSPSRAKSPAGPTSSVARTAPAPRGAPPRRPTSSAAKTRPSLTAHAHHLIRTSSAARIAANEPPGLRDGSTRGESLEAGAAISRHLRQPLLRVLHRPASNEARRSRHE